MSQTTSLDTIQDFLAQARIAMIGISRERNNISGMLFAELRRRGYDMVPVNPNMSEVMGQRCFARVQDVRPPVQAAILMTSPTVTDQVVADCFEAGIPRIWMYRGGGRGAVSFEAVQFCRDRGIGVISGECPFMFLSDAAGIHRLHRFIRKITGHYPRRNAA
jgi:predicted CoA-binding protein